MRLKGYDFQRKEDEVVFKALLRCMKEDDLFNFRRKINIAKMVGDCYISRKEHSRESFETNISYWPGDIGAFKYPETKLIYFSLLINNLPKTHVNQLKPKFISLLKNIFANPHNLSRVVNGNIEHFEDELCKTFVKCGDSEEKANMKAKAIILTLKGSKLDLPL